MAYTYILTDTQVIRSDGMYIPKDVTNKEYAAFLAAQPSIDPALIYQQPIDPVPALTVAVQAALDAGARQRGYDNIATAITYRGDPNPKFAAEAEVYFQWRSDTWTTAYSILADVEAGKRAFPTNEEAIALLPPLVLP